MEAFPEPVMCIIIIHENPPALSSYTLFRTRIPCPREVNINILGYHAVMRRPVYHQLPGAGYQC